MSQTTFRLTRYPDYIVAHASLRGDGEQLADRLFRDYVLVDNVPICRACLGGVFGSHVLEGHDVDTVVGALCTCLCNRVSVDHGIAQVGWWLGRFWATTAEVVERVQVALGPPVP